MKTTAAPVVRKLVAALSLAAVAAVGPLEATEPATMYTGLNPAPNYARAVQLGFGGANNGRMYATFEHAVTEQPVFHIYESADNGATWRPKSELADTQNGWGLRYQPFLYELPEKIGELAAGTLLCAGNSIPADMSQTKIDLYRSTDHARHWSFVSSVARGGRADPAGTQDPVWEPFLLVANGKLICYYSDERDPAHNQKIVHQVSTDGVNWGPVVEDIAFDDPKLRPGMPVITRLNDGRYLMVYEIVGLPVTGTFYQISANPESWQPASRGTKISDGGAPYVTTLSDGALVVAEMDHDALWVNRTNGTGAWQPLANPLGKGYSRCLVPLANGRLFLSVSIGNDIRHADFAWDKK